AFASDAGMAATSRARGRNRPVSTISSAVTRNAPTTAGKPPAGSPTVSRNAAPGVDQAKLIGVRVRALTAMFRTPRPRHSAISPEPAWVGVAPAAVKAASTKVKVLA